VKAVKASDPTRAIRESMNHDVPTWFDPKFSGALAIFRVWIRDVDRAVKVAVFVAAVENVEPLGRLMIVAFCFRPDYIPTQATLYILRALPLLNSVRV
jgi:hypothetical protein